MLQIAFLLLLIAGLAEINVTPFDIMEAESELVAGFNTEYSGMKFALFFLAEFAASFTLSAIIVTLFLGGFQPPLAGLGRSAHWHLALAGVAGVVHSQVLGGGAADPVDRSTLPRVRMDQLMNLSWKALIPAGLANLLLTGAYVALWLAR